MSGLAYRDEFASFFDIPRSHRSPTNFSPEVDVKFQGIRIAAPEEITLPKAALAGGEPAYVPICLTYQFTALYYREFDRITDHMSIVAVDAGTGRSYTGSLKEGDPDITPERTETTPREVLERMLVGGYYTINLLEFTEIPPGEATYLVHVVLEKHQSNVIRIVLRKAGA